MKLNLAAGTDLRDPPWQNWDIVKRWPTNKRDADRIWDARTDRIPCADASVDEICAGYLLTHVSYRHHTPLIAEMHRVMKPGARLVVDEVDMSKAAQRWLSNPRDLDARNIMWGEVGTVHGAEFEEFDAHRSGLTPSLLIELLTKAGFQRVTRIQLHHESVWYQLTFEAFR